MRARRDLTQYDVYFCFILHPSSDHGSLSGFRSWPAGYSLRRVCVPGLVFVWLDDEQRLSPVGAVSFVVSKFLVHSFLILLSFPRLAHIPSLEYSKQPLSIIFGDFLT